MKPNSIVFKFSPDGSQRIVYCAWCDQIKQYSLPMILDLGGWGSMPIAHGICDLHAKEFKEQYKNEKLSSRMEAIINNYEEDSITNSDFEYFASRNS